MRPGQLIILVGVLTIACSSAEQYKESDLKGSWMGHLIQSHELSYAFDTQGHLPVKVVGMPVEGLIEFDFNEDFVLLTVENRTQVFQYSLTKKSGSKYLELNDGESKVLVLRVVKIQDNMLELVQSNSSDRRILSNNYILSRRSN